MADRPNASEALAAQMTVARYPDPEVVEWASKASLRDWRYDRGKNVVRGRISGDPGFRDGARITTSPVLYMYRSGNRLMAMDFLRLYELTSPDGEEWFAYADRMMNV